MPKVVLERDPETHQFLPTHGESRLHETPEYAAWGSMRRRCYFSGDPKQVRFYQSRGVTVCDRWRNSYPNFLADMGRKPTPRHTLDRIDSDKGYEPGNYRWATWTEQANNRRPAGAYWRRVAHSLDEYVLVSPAHGANW